MNGKKVREARRQVRGFLLECQRKRSAVTAEDVGMVYRDAKAAATGRPLPSERFVKNTSGSVPPALRRRRKSLRRQHERTRKTPATITVAPTQRAAWRSATAYLKARGFKATRAAVEGMARGHTEQRLVDLIVGWEVARRNPTCSGTRHGFGRRNKTGRH